MGKLGHVRALDGLRGVAIAMVVAYHFFGLPGGFYGVDVFFVLSGFLITTLLIERQDRITTFYVRRVRRLLPAVAALVLAVFTLYALVGRTEHGLSLAVLGGTYAANIVRGYIRPDALEGTPFGHLWSLAEEEQFYLLWPAVLMLATPRMTQRRILITLTALFVALVSYRCALGMAGTAWQRLYFAPDTHADGLVLGCAAASARQCGSRIPAWSGWVGLAVIVGSSMEHMGTLALTVGLPLVEIAAAVTVLAPPRILNMKPLVKLGVLSYSLYVWHQPARWILDWRDPVLALMFAVGLTVASYRYIERPFRQWRTIKQRALLSNA